MSERGKLLWTEKITVRWGDMDALGHVNNTEYFRYMEQARVSWFDAHGIPMLLDGCGPVMVRGACNFVRAITYPAQIAIDMRLARLGDRSVTLYHDLYLDGDPKTKFADGEIVVVWIDHARGVSLPLPDVMRSLVQH
jgi:acyl-CoA thioester hydrolase